MPLLGVPEIRNDDLYIYIRIAIHRHLLHDLDIVLERPRKKRLFLGLDEIRG